ncbi:MAG TPA: PEGA domain-containing protein, partial [Planctomycetota bacterium]|nr:PEGA domain-containing protein [Planctomycetota bacterium]
GEIEIAWLDAEGADVRGWAIRIKSEQREVHYSSPETRVIGVLPGRIDLELQAKGYRTWKSTVQVVAGQVTKVEARFEKGEDPK